MQRRRRVAVTRDESDADPLTSTLREAGFEPVGCPVLIERPPRDTTALIRAARALESFDWAIFTSQRAVTAIMTARDAPLPQGLRTAAVGRRTMAALVQAGADPPPLVADAPGSAALWHALSRADAWQDRAVLLPVAAKGRRDLIDALRDAGATVTEVIAYTMQARGDADIRRDWHDARPDAAVIASPRTARVLHAAVGHDALARLAAIVAIGQTTHDALADLGLRAMVSPESDFRAAVRQLVTLWTPA